MQYFSPKFLLSLQTIQLSVSQATSLMLLYLVIKGGAVEKRDMKTSSHPKYPRK